MKQTSACVCNAPLRNTQSTQMQQAVQGEHLPPILTWDKDLSIAPIFTALFTLSPLSHCIQTSATCLSSGFTKGDPNTQHCPALWNSSASICAPCLLAVLLHLFSSPHEHIVCHQSQRTCRASCHSLTCASVQGIPGKRGAGDMQQVLPKYPHSLCHGPCLTPNTIT